VCPEPALSTAKLEALRAAAARLRALHPQDEEALRRIAR
jgi:hypothetical protein